MVTNRMVYPSEDFPGPLPFLLEVPADWLALHVPGSMLAARSPQDDGDFSPNVTVTWQRGSVAVTAQKIAEALLSSLDGDGELLGLDLDPDFDGSVSLVRSNATSAGDAITQTALAVVGPPTSPRTRDVFQVVGSHRTASTADRTLIRGILTSFAFVDVGALTAA